MSSLIQALIGPLLAALLFVASPAGAQELAQIPGAGVESERAAVLATLRAYLRVTDAADEASIAASFHPGAPLLALTKAGSVSAMTQEVWWERVGRAPAGSIKRESVIRLIDVEGGAAVARIDITTGTSKSTDYFNLLKTRAGWRIVNKTLSTPLG